MFSSPLPLLLVLCSAFLHEIFLLICHSSLPLCSSFPPPSFFFILSLSTFPSPFPSCLFRPLPSLPFFPLYYFSKKMALIPPRGGLHSPKRKTIVLREGLFSPIRKIMIIVLRRLYHHLLLVFILPSSSPGHKVFS